MKNRNWRLRHSVVAALLLLIQTSFLHAVGHWEISHLPYPVSAEYPSINNSNEIVWDYPGINSNLRGKLADIGLFPHIANSGEVVYADWFGGPYWDLVSTTRGRLTQGNIIDLNTSAFDVNSSGEVVYVTKDTNGINQVYSTIRGQITFNANPHSNPCINDLGEIIWTENVEGLGMKAVSTTRGRLPGNYFVINDLNNTGDFCYTGYLGNSSPHLFSYFYGAITNDPAQFQWGGSINDSGTAVWMGTNGLYEATWVGMSPPIIQLNDPEPLTNECHAAFTDPGAIAFSFVSPPVPGQPNTTNYLPVTVSGTVDTNSPGTYPLTYAATNSEGVVATVTRDVIVADTTPPSFLSSLADLKVDDTNLAGASIVYAPPTAADACSGNVSISFSPPSGSYLAIGANTIVCYATDESGNSAQSLFTVTVLGPQGIKKDILNTLLAAQPQIQARQLSTYNLSIAVLTRSLTPNFWINETHLNAKNGKTAFADDAAATRLMSRIISRESDSVINSLLQNGMERLANADRLLTEFKIEDAVIANADEKQIIMAMNEVSRGDQAVANRNYSIAILRYQNAWQRLSRTLRH